MGLYDNVILDDEVELPEFSGNPQDLSWQSKTVNGQPFMNNFKITNDGKLYRQEKTHRDMTDEEIQEKAEKHGYSSWSAWEDADSFGPLESWKTVTDEVWWVDHHKHGSFEIHASTRHLDGDDKIYWSYEVRFTKGNLDEIILLKKKDLSA